jgi:glycosyltransferase involved in cell wall biosynthesis
MRVLLPTAAEDLGTVPLLDGALLVGAREDGPRAIRRALPRLLTEAGASLYVSPWTALPAWEGPMVAWVHELPFVRLGPIEGRVRTLRQRRHVARLLRRAAGVVVPSHATREDLLQLHPTLAPRVHVIPNAFDPAVWAPATAPPGERYAVIVGTGAGAAGGRKKGMDLVPALRAALAPSLALRVLGAPHASPETVQKAVAGARVLLHPARSEGFGYPLLEAMAAGVPVVTSDGGALPETAGDAAQVVPAGDVEAMARAACALAMEGAARDARIAAGRLRARAFAPSIVAGQWRTLFQALSGQPA